jgi:hypothetical protein
MSVRLNEGDIATCPLCGKSQGEPVEDFVLSGVGPESECEDDCAHCGAYFTVMRVAPGEYEILAV